jgi:hypothetical protein
MVNGPKGKEEGRRRRRRRRKKKKYHCDSVYYFIICSLLFFGPRQSKYSPQQLKAPPLYLPLNSTYNSALKSGSIPGVTRFSE